MTRSPLPPSLDTFLDESLPRLADPPDADWLAIIADMHGTTPEVVWQGVRAKMPDAPVAPPPFVPPALPPDVVVDRSPGSPSKVGIVARTVESLRARGFEAVVAAFRQRGHELKANRKGFLTRCPLHQDRRPSLQISRAPDDGRTALLHCHSCGKTKQKQILAAVGLTKPDCFPDDLTAYVRPVREVLAEYPYITMASTHIATKVRQRDRFHVKSFRWRVGDRWRLTDAEKAALPLYRERDLIKCSTIYIVEGEKAVDRLWDAGLPATCAPHGAGTWEPRWTESLHVLSTQHVVILTDHDAAGRAHGELVATALHDAQIAVQVVALPNLGRGQDVYDWLAQGGTVENLETIVAATPAWSPGLAERQRVERQKVRWREKKQRQRLKRRERDTLRMSASVPPRSLDTRDVPLRSLESAAARQNVPPVPLSPLRTISRVTSKEVDSSYVSGDVEALPTNEGDLVIEIALCRDIEFAVEIHAGGDDDGGDDG